MIAKKSITKDQPTPVSKTNWARSIQAKFILKFLPVLLLIPALLAVVTYYGQKQSVQKIAREYLDSVVTLKSRALESYFSSGVENLRILSSTPLLQDLAKLELPIKQKRRVQEQVFASVRGFLKGALRSDTAFDEFFILDREEGRVLVSTNRENEGKIYRPRAFFKEAFKGPFTEKFQILPGESKPVVCSGAPVTSFTGVPIAILAGRHNFKPVSVLMEEVSVLGNTGDTYLFNENRIFLTNPRNLPDVMLKRPVLTAAARRTFREGSGSGVYQGVTKQTMLGSFKYLKKLGLGLVAEESLNEALQSIRDLKKNLVMAALLVTVFSLLSLWVISRQIVKPLSRLSQAVTKFSRGDFGARADIQNQDEIGHLAENFNSMAGSLEKLYGRLEEQVSKRTEELVNSLLETEEARAEWEDTFHAMSDSLFVYDAKNILRRMNKSAEEIIGKKETEARGYPLNELLPILPPQDSDGVFVSGIEVTDQAADQIYRVSNFIKRDAKGIYRGGVLVYRNVTDEKQRVEAYREVQAQLLEASKLAAIGTLSAGIAHEFNNIIAGIRLHADLALNLKKTDKMERALRIAAESSERAAKIISSLLVFSRRKSSEKKPEKLQDVITETMSLIEADFQARGIAVIKKFDPLPLIEIDRGQISQVILNLLTNARDAVLNRKDAQIEIVLRQDEFHAILEVADNGEGISPENLPKIFEPFFTTKGLLSGGMNTAPGTGLGLSISYGIIQSHGGVIEVKSKFQEGSRFIVRLPFSRTAQVETEKEPPKEIVMSGKSIPKQEILVADDEEHIRRALKEALEAMGHKVWLAKEGTEALEIVRKVNPTVMFVDLLMPGVSGMEFLKNLQSTKNNGKIIVMSGIILEDETPLYQLGVAHILRKPFKVSDLAPLFVKVLGEV